MLVFRKTLRTYYMNDPTVSIKRSPGVKLVINKIQAISLTKRNCASKCSEKPLVIIITWYWLLITILLLFILSRIHEFALCGVNVGGIKFCLKHVLCDIWWSYASNMLKKNFFLNEFFEKKNVIKQLVITTYIFGLFLTQGLFSFKPGK